MTRSRRSGRKPQDGHSSASVAHDITADRSALQSRVDPTSLRNARSPTIDLECLLATGRSGIRFCSSERSGEAPQEPGR